MEMKIDASKKVTRGHQQSRSIIVSVLETFPQQFLNESLGFFLLSKRPCDTFFYDAFCRTTKSQIYATIEERNLEHDKSVNCTRH